jgi:hypothetical protein
MPNEIPQAPAPEDGTSPAPKDLRAELMSSLKIEFAANLSADGTLPKVARDALVALLCSAVPTSTDVITALGSEVPPELGTPND